MAFDTVEHDLRVELEAARAELARRDRIAERQAEIDAATLEREAKLRRDLDAARARIAELEGAGRRVLHEFRPDERIATNDQARALDVLDDVLDDDR